MALVLPNPHNEDCPPSFVGAKAKTAGQVPMAAFDGIRWKTMPKMRNGPINPLINGISSRSFPIISRGFTTNRRG